MIASFGDKLTEALYHGTKHNDLRRLPFELVNRILRKLDMINAAHERFGFTLTAGKQTRTA